MVDPMFMIVWNSWLWICVPVYLCTCVPEYMCTCVPVYLCTCVPVYLCTCVPVYLCTCVHCTVWNQQWPQQRDINRGLHCSTCQWDINKETHKHTNINTQTHKSCQYNQPTVEIWQVLRIHVDGPGKKVSGMTISHTSNTPVIPRICITGITC